MTIEFATCPNEDCSSVDAQSFTVGSRVEQVGFRSIDTCAWEVDVQVKAGSSSGSGSVCLDTYSGLCSTFEYTAAILEPELELTNGFILRNRFGSFGRRFVYRLFIGDEVEITRSNFTCTQCNVSSVVSADDEKRAVGSTFLVFVDAVCDGAHTVCIGGTCSGGVSFQCLTQGIFGDGQCSGQ